MNIPTLSTEELKKIFKDVPSNDPKIKLNDNLVKLIPSYWNQVFVLNFIPFFAGIYVLTQQNDLKIILGSLFLIAISLYSIYDQLSYYNNIYIDYKKKIITVEPNILRRILKKIKKIDFENIKKIDLKESGFGASHIRYVIIIELKDNHHINLISTTTKNNAGKIVNVLLKII